MSAELFQLVILSAAYLLSMIVLVGAVISTFFSVRSLRALENRKSTDQKLKELKGGLVLLEDTVDRFGKRWAKRARDKQKKDDDSDDTDVDFQNMNDQAKREVLMRDWKARQEA